MNQVPFATQESTGACGSRIEKKNGTARRPSLAANRRSIHAGQPLYGPVCCLSAKISRAKALVKRSATASCREKLPSGSSQVRDRVASVSKAHAPFANRRNGSGAGSLARRSPPARGGL